MFEVEENILSNGLNRVLFTRCVTAELREEHFAKSAFAQKRFFLKIFKLTICVLLISVPYHDRLTFSEALHLRILSIALQIILSSNSDPRKCASRNVIKVSRGLRLILERQLFDITFSLLKLLIVLVFALDLLID